MSDDRYLHDPFAPQPTALVGAVQPPPVDEAGEDGEHGDGDDLESMKKDDLIALAKKRDLPFYGNKDDLIARLRGED